MQIRASLVFIVKLLFNKCWDASTTALEALYDIYDTIHNFPYIKKKSLPDADIIKRIL